MSDDKVSKGGFNHDRIETSNGLMILLILLVVAIGGLVEIVPLFFQKSTTEPVTGLQPYTALQLMGRDVYLREGCYNCHSQMIRPLRAEVLRYGHYSVAGEFVYDHPFQWGSKRIGPDLARVGGKYSNDWHYAHLVNPQAMVPESLMPKYAFLADTPLDTDLIQSHLRTNRTLGVPYTDEDIANARADIALQANPQGDTDALLKRYPKAVIVPGNGAPTELDALVAYLQVLGTMVDFADVNTENLQQ